MRRFSLATNDLRDLGGPLLCSAARTLRCLIRVQERLQRRVRSEDRPSSTQRICPRLLILVSQASRQTARQVTLHLNIRGCLTAQRAHDASAHTRHETGNCARHIPRAEHLGNTRAHFAAQHVITRRGRNLSRTRSDDLLDTISGLLIRPMTRTGSIEGTRRFREGRGDRPSERAADDGSALRSVSTNRFQERTDRSNRIDRHPPTSGLPPPTRAALSPSLSGPKEPHPPQGSSRSRDQLPPARRCECPSLCPIHPHRRGTTRRGYLAYRRT